MNISTGRYPDQEKPLSTSLLSFVSSKIDDCLKEDLQMNKLGEPRSLNINSNSSFELKNNTYSSLSSIEVNQIAGKYFSQNQNLFQVLDREEKPSYNVKNVDIFPELSLLFMSMKNVACFVRLFDANLNYNFRTEEKERKHPLNNPLFFELDSEITAIAVGRAPQTLSRAKKYEHIAIISTRTKSKLIFIQMTSGPVEYEESNIKLPFGNLRKINISQNGRVFIMQEDSEIQEVCLRDQNYSSNEIEVTKIIKSIFFGNNTREFYKTRNPHHKSITTDIGARVKGFLQKAAGFGSNDQIYYSQIEIDETRNILYQMASIEHKTLFSRETLDLLRVYDLGETSEEFIPVTEINFKELLQKIATLSCDSLNLLDNCSSRVASISVSTGFDHPNVNLIIFFENGLQVFLEFGGIKRESVQPQFNGFYRHDIRPSHEWKILAIRPPIRPSKRDFQFDSTYSSRFCTLNAPQEKTIQSAKYINEQYFYLQRERDQDSNGNYNRESVLFVTFKPSFLKLNQTGPHGEIVSSISNKFSSHNDNFKVFELPYPLNQTSTLRNLIKCDPFTLEKLGGHSLNNILKTELSYYPQHIRQIFIEPEVIALSDNKEVHTFIRHRPVDCLFSALYQQTKLTQNQPQSQSQSNSTSQFTVFNLFGGTCRLPVSENISVELLSIMAELGPLETLVSLFQILCSKDEDRFYLNFEPRSGQREPRINRTNSQTTFSSNLGNVPGDRSKFCEYNGFTLFEVRQMKKTPEIHSLAVEFLKRLGSMSLVEPSASQTAFFAAQGFNQTASNTKTLLLEAFFSYLSRLIRPVWKLNWVVI